MTHFFQNNNIAGDHRVIAACRRSCSSRQQGQDERCCCPTIASRRGPVAAVEHPTEWKMVHTVVKMSIHSAAAANGPDEYSCSARVAPEEVSGWHCSCHVREIQGSMNACGSHCTGKNKLQQIPQAWRKKPSLRISTRQKQHDYQKCGILVLL